MIKTPAEIVARYAVELTAAGIVEEERGTFRQHALWMCNQMQRSDFGPTEKAMHWLGFIQGVLFVYGKKTIDELRKDCK